MGEENSMKKILVHKASKEIPRHTERKEVAKWGCDAYFSKSEQGCSVPIYKSGNKQNNK